LGLRQTCRCFADSGFTLTRADHHYQVLGITSLATKMQIKQAYLECAKRDHPDKHGGAPEFHRRFLEVQEAFDVLSNRKRRRAYDADMEVSVGKRFARKMRAHAKVRNHSMVLQVWAELVAVAQSEGQGRTAIEADLMDVLFESSFEAGDLGSCIRPIREAVAHGMLSDDALLCSFNKLLYFCELQICASKSAPGDMQFIMDVIGELEASAVAPDMGTYEMLDRIFAFAPHSVELSIDGGAKGQGLPHG
jgi:DnaJ-class molecular chaperone